MSEQTNTIAQPAAWTIEEWFRHRRLGRTKGFEEIKAGRIRTYRVGKRRFVTRDADQQWEHDRLAETETV